MALYYVTALSYIAAVLVVIPSPSQWRTKNIPTLSIIAWLFITNVFQGTNTIIWANNVRVVASVYCDIGEQNEITTKFTKALGGLIEDVSRPLQGNMLWMASTWGLPASTVCLTRYLASVTSPNYAPIGINERRKRFWFEMIMCVFMPFIFSGLHYILQSHRFYIEEDFGCKSADHVTWAAIWLLLAPTFALSIVSAIFGGISVYRLARCRMKCRKLFANSASGLATSQYYRLMAISLQLVITDLIMKLYVEISEVKAYGIYPWVSWAYVHEHYDEIPTFSKGDESRVGWINKVVGSIIPVTYAFAFFFLFGFGEEAFSDYRRIWAWIKTHIFRVSSSAAVVAERGNMTHPNLAGSEDSSA
ncbi:pheromone A receptor-domain-containing protein [Cantharellus anzutake]|uniref:pheromone A receptor-domain-containing protein n=1 Tax=Cantharellus anzutake TaxID=1750568 RepID=UPI0019074573|nr:pheromone A receptor-domain-containing protein [Cantharellus anzutake]KAF8332029.1 pheromone A receptor-domain-containing protein [Cantharellus anzutake]